MILICSESQIVQMDQNCLCDTVIILNSMCDVLLSYWQYCYIKADLPFLFVLVFLFPRKHHTRFAHTISSFVFV